MINDLSNKLQIGAGEAQAAGETKMLDIAILFYLEDEVLWICGNIKNKWLEQQTTNWSRWAPSGRRDDLLQSGSLAWQEHIRAIFGLRWTFSFWFLILKVLFFNFCKIFSNLSKYFCILQSFSNLWLQKNNSSLDWMHFNLWFLQSRSLLRSCPCHFFVAVTLAMFKVRAPRLQVRGRCFNKFYFLFVFFTWVCSQPSEDKWRGSIKNAIF